MINAATELVYTVLYVTANLEVIKLNISAMKSYSAILNKNSVITKKMRRAISLFFQFN
jgi:hypothetical protein